MNKDNIVKLLIAIGLVGLLAVIVFFIMNFDFNKTKEEADLSLDLESDIVSKNPKESAANFIKYNGTIGELESLSEDNITKREFKENNEMRLNTFEHVKDAIIPDSPLITGGEEDHIDTQREQFPIFYSVQNVKVSEPSDVNKKTIHHNEIGSVEYESVDVYVDFESVQTTFYWPTDASSDGIITKEVASDNFEDVEVTLVKSGDLWFIYDVANSEYTLNARMSTWSGKGQYDVSPEQEVVDEYIMEDIYNIEEAENNNEDNDKEAEDENE